MNGAMVRAILAGHKTQTRRAVKGVPLEWLDQHQFTPDYVSNPGNGLCPMGKPGDQLWVRETWRPKTIHSCAMDTCDCDGVGVTYAADGEWIPHTWQNPVPDDWYMPASAARGNVPSIHMPRWACRLVLEITDVRLERLQQISEADCLAEGVQQDEANGFDIEFGIHYSNSAVGCFASLWDSTGGDWKANPWVWAVTFKRIEE